jgi:hypothetical protein
MFTRRTLYSGLVLTLAASLSASAQDPRGRKYKAPPETSHIDVLVLKDSNQKPVANAAVVFHSVKDGKDEGNLEVKTNSEGKATIDVIPTGSSVDVQVIADGFATFAGNYLVAEPTRSIEVRMIKPRAQISTYIDTRGQPAARPLGVQEPNKPSTPPVIQAPQPTTITSDPSALAPGAMNYTPPATPKGKPGVPVQTNPADIHPDNQYPVDPATAPKPSTTTPPTSPAPPQS